MIRRLPQLLLALLVLPAPGAAQAHRDPAFHLIARFAPTAPHAGARPADSRDLARGGPRPGPLAGLEMTASGPVVHALARVGPRGETALRTAGASIGARVGDIVTLRFPLAALEGVLTAPGVAVLEAAAPLRAAWSRPAAATAAALDNDVARDEIRVDGLRRRVGDRFVGLAGQGVVVGVYDSGLDLSHPDFLRADGSTRVVAAWDQTDTTGPTPGAMGPHSFGYGTVCTPADIDAASCALDDTHGHGTHVAGTAAGDGSATGKGQPAYRFAGTAPEADLVIVRGDTATSFPADRVVDGVAYIFAVAERLGRPAVVVLALGTLRGPHDGTTLVEQALSGLSGPGRIIVAAHGNHGANDNEDPGFADGPQHDEGMAGDAASLLVPAYSPRPGAVNDGLSLELWYDGADSLDIVVTSPGGHQARAATGDTAVVETPDGAILILNAPDGPAENGDHGALIVIADGDADAPPAEGTWTLRAEAGTLASGSSGPWHAWLWGSSLDVTSRLAHFDGGTNRFLSESPASADRVLAAAFYAARHRWTTLGGQPASFLYQEPLGDIAFLSSPGPRRDGVLKPDLAAPGKVVVSALARNATLWSAEALGFFIEADSVHVGLLGSSMAAPQMAGAVALLLQLEPGLAPKEARELLVGSARRDAFTSHTYTGDPDGSPNVQWGYGKLDVAAAVQELRPDGLAPADRIALSANPIRGDVLVLTYPTPPDRVTVYTLTGRRVRVLLPGDIGPLSTVWPLDNDGGAAVANGPYLIVAEFGAERVMKKVFVARP